MALNPLTGEMEYGDYSYDPQNMTAGMAMRGMAKGDVDVPLAFQLTESIPGLSTTSLVNSRRYANTLFKGGFADVGAGTTGRRLSRAKKLGGFVGNQTAVPGSSSGMFFGANSNSKFLRNLAQKRAAKANATPFLSQSLNTNFRPRALNRLSSLTSLTGDKSLGFYTPFQSMSGMVSGAFDKSARLRSLAKLEEGDKAFSGGVLGRIESINRISNLESTIARGTSKLASGGTMSRRQSIRYGKAIAQKSKLVDNIARVQSLANPSLNAIQNSPAVTRAAITARQSTRAAMRAGSSILSPGTTAPTRVIASAVRASGQAARTAANAAALSNYMDIAANPTRAVASTMTTGKLSNRITSYYAGTVDLMNMTSGQQRLMHKVSTRLGANSGMSAKTFAANFMDDFAAGGKYTGNFLARGAGGGKMMATAFQYAKAGGKTSTALKFGAMGASRTLGAALTPLNVLATGQLIYDIGKGFGKVAVAGANFAKDALKSMQGSISKPMFGTGFKDNEVAATSRARGVMAIQNSRLNARSLLGSEASMMAAHFG
jgi:hypothetical protein